MIMATIRVFKWHLLKHSIVYIVGLRFVFDVCESSLLCPEIINERLEKVQKIMDRLKTANSWQKYYADNRTKYL